MHILLTDLMACPRCGAGFGLILRADAMVGRRVAEGALGCANCREQYPITGFGADLALGERLDWGGGCTAGDAERLAALAGVTSAPAYLLVLGPAAEHGAALAALVPGVEVVTAGWAGEGSEVSRLEVGRVLPFQDGRFAGVIVTGAVVGDLLGEAARVVRPGGRVVVAAPGAVEGTRLAGVGLKVVAEDARTMVCVRS